MENTIAGNADEMRGAIALVAMIAGIGGELAFEEAGHERLPQSAAANAAVAGSLHQDEGAWQQPRRE